MCQSRFSELCKGVDILERIFYTKMQMSKLSQEDILKLAQLSKLELTDQEVEEFRTEIDAILGYVEQLQSVDVSGLEPTSQVTGLTNVMRADKERDYGTSQEDLLKNLPQRDKNLIKVRRVL